jgi:hypothetical protein
VTAQLSILSLCNCFHTFQNLQSFTSTKNTNTREVETDKKPGIYHFLQVWEVSSSWVLTKELNRMFKKTHPREEQELLDGDREATVFSQGEQQRRRFEDDGEIGRRDRV